MRRMAVRYTIQCSYLGKIQGVISKKQLKCLYANARNKANGKMDDEKKAIQLHITTTKMGKGKKTQELNALK